MGSCLTRGMGATVKQSGEQGWGGGQLNNEVKWGKKMRRGEGGKWGKGRGLWGTGRGLWGTGRGFWGKGRRERGYGGRDRDYVRRNQFHFHIF